MKAMRRIFAVVISLAMTAGIVGCGKSGKVDNSDKTIEIFAYNAGYGIEWLNAVKDAFIKKNPEYKIVIKEQATADVLDTIIRSGPSANTYDLLLVSEVWNRYLDQGNRVVDGYDFVLENLDDVYNSTVEGEDVTVGEKMFDFYKNYYQYDVYDEETGETTPHYFAMPWASGLCGLFYNKTLFDANGLKTEPRTTDELLKYCETLKKNGVTPLIYASNVGYSEYLYYT